MPGDRLAMRHDLGAARTPTAARAQAARAPRVAHLSSAHPWNDVRIFIKEARALAAAGYDVSVVAQRAESADVDGIHCVALPFTASRVARMLLGPARVLREARGYDIVHFHDPELIPVGMLLKLLGKRVIYDVHEDVPRQIADKDWLWPLARMPVALLAEAFETLAARMLDRIVAVTPTIARRFPADRTVLVQNYPLQSELCPQQHAAPYHDRPPHFAFVGALTQARGAREMIAAIAQVESADARLVMAGTISPPTLLGALQTQPGWARTSFCGSLDRPAVARLLASVRAGLVLFHPIANHVNAQPNKLFEYMSAGLPVIASDFPLWREIVGDNGAGLLVDPLDPAAIAAAMGWVLDNPADAERMGRRGQEAVVAKYNWESEAQKLLALYDSLH